MSESTPDEISEPRPRVTGHLVEPDELATPLLVAVGRVVFAVAALEKSLQLELGRLLLVREAGEPHDSNSWMSEQLAALENMTAGRLLNHLRKLGLSADLDRRISAVIERRNQLVHLTYEDADLVKAFSGGEDLDRMVGRLEQLAIDSGEVALELHLVALPKLEAMFGVSQAELIELVKNTDPDSIADPRFRTQLLAIQAFGDLDDLAATLNDVK
jgi:uncharacterized protein YidB (DUF937 family)